MATLRPEELAAKLRDCPVVYVPSGIYEWHDEQNPLGTDTLKVVEMCRLTAARTGGVVHMPSYIGVGAFNDPVGPMQHGGLNFSPELVRSYLTELFEQLEKFGVQLIVLLYGHTNPANINAHEQAAIDYLRRENAQAKVLCVNDVEPEHPDIAGKQLVFIGPVEASCPGLLHHNIDIGTRPGYRF